MAKRVSAQAPVETVAPVTEINELPVELELEIVSQEIEPEVESAPPEPEVELAVAESTMTITHH